MAGQEKRKETGQLHRRLWWEDNIKIDLQEMEWVTDWIDVAQDMDRWRALVNAVMSFQVP